MTRKKKPHENTCYCGVLIKDSDHDRCEDCEEAYQKQLDMDWVREKRLAEEAKNDA